MVVRILYLIVVACVAMACGGTGRSVEVHDMEHSVWSTTEDFVYDNSDTLSHRDISIVVRYGGGRVAESVALTVMTISPDSMVVAEPFTLHIPQLGDMRPAEHTFTYRRSVVLGSRGEYLFRLKPTTAAEGISSVGIMVTEPEIAE